jgi:DNA-binding NtrC family response regulator
MKRQLLVVDDEAEIRRMLERHFRMLGYTVVTASQGAEALEILAQRRVDVVISDIIMPVMDGVSLLREIRRQYPMIRVIMITGQVTLENALACMRNQADTCIFKPLTDLAQLEAAVEHAFQVLERWNQIFRELQGLPAAVEGHVA